jgi:hypothetical protein
MTRLAITIALCLSLLLIVKGIVTTFESSPLPEEKAGEIQKGKVYKGSRPITLYPPVPAKLPDLDRGYLFNEERNLGGGVKAGGDNSDISVNIDDVVYEGSLIIGDVRKAIISYPSIRKAIISYPSKPGGTARRSSRSGRVPTKDREHVRVSENETISGYKVVEILPEKITFEKGSERTEKLLFDSLKQREIAGRPTKPAGTTPAVPTLANAVAQFKRTIKTPQKGNTRPTQKPPEETQAPIPPEILKAIEDDALANSLETER